MITKSINYAYVKDEKGESTPIPNPRFIQKCMQEHIKEVNRLKKLYELYKGEDVLKAREDKVTINNAKNIVDTINGYVFAQPITYADGNIEDLVDWMRIVGEDRHNTELGKDMGIYGKAYELEYMDDLLGTGDNMPVFSKMSPLNTFVVYNTDIRNTPIMGITYSEVKNLDDITEYFTVIVYTGQYIFTYKCGSLDGLDYTLVNEPEEHFFNGVPLIRLTNGEEEKSDFEDVVSLIEAYNSLMTNRVVDKQKFVDSILMISNMTMGDDDDEVASVVNKINENRMIETGENGDAKWLTKALSESDVEVLKKAIRDEICTITKCPNLTDENFVGNASGEAMKYKVMGLEQIGKTKESYFKKFLRERLKTLQPVLKLKGINIELPDVTINMKRTLPKNELERLQILQGTEGILSLRTRIIRYDEELNVDEEIKALEEEQNKKNISMANAFGSYSYPQQNQPLNNGQEKEQKDMENTLYNK